MQSTDVQFLTYSFSLTKLSTPSFPVAILIKPFENLSLRAAVKMSDILSIHFLSASSDTIFSQMGGFQRYISEGTSRVFSLRVNLSKWYNLGFSPNKFIARHMKDF